MGKDARTGMLRIILAFVATMSLGLLFVLAEKVRRPLARLVRALLFGLVGVLTVIIAFLWMTRRIMHIGRQSIALDRVFAGLVAQGVGIWIGFQAFINMGVNLGALPTKGLTLPLMSYGGSAVLMNVVAIAVVLRIDYENRTLMRGGRA